MVKNIIEEYLDRVDFDSVYINVAINTPIEFRDAVLKYKDEYNITETLRSAKNHIRKTEDGPITIKGVNYKVSKIFFEVFSESFRISLNKEADIYLAQLRQDSEYIATNAKTKAKIDFEFRCKFTYRLYKKYSLIRTREKIASGEINKKPEKPNYESKDAYIKSCVGTEIIKAYIDDYKMLAATDDFVL